MSEYDDDFEFETEEPEEDSPENLIKKLPNAARKHLRKLEKQAKEMEKALGEAQKELSGFKVRDVLTERGVTDQRAHTLLAKSGVDLADANAVGDWLNEYGDLFGHTATAAPEQANALAAGLAQMNATQAKGAPEGDASEAVAQISQMTPDELDAFIRANSHIKIPLT